MNAIKSDLAKKIMASKSAQKDYRRMMSTKASRDYAHEHGYVVQTEDGKYYRISVVPRFF